ncbi:RAB6A-GEF complex partner protein 2 [Neocloeon triangulifer]|uniref:RAB6A-GEF complex partner protein 2 n=1 Tax=Neocloeon triangulifer TaxID=2078957 RepID=UPI00286F1D1F|nr:RAB6A-GEF complex partner protein 2 [Neocloeon triangulifer]
MIELTARLLRGPVYLAGEMVECSVTFRNPSPPENTRSQSNNDVFENLAWASVQMHCICAVNESRVSGSQEGSSVEEAANSLSHTSYVPCKGENGQIVLATKPKILFCDLRLSSGESKTFLYTETLPSEAPPSFRGQAVKYSYKLTVGVQRVNLPIKMLRVPLRVLVIQGITETFLYGENDELTPNNPFLEHQQKESATDLALQELQNITARRSPNFYNITNSRGKVVRFCLFKQAYKLGEDIVGTFDFVDAAVPCVQLSVALQSEEEIEEGRRHHPNQAPAVSISSKAHEVCLGLQNSHLCLPIPLHLAPTFSTNLVSLKWKLHFEFVISVEPEADLKVIPDDGGTWQGPANLPIETMVWDLPVTIYPSNPQLVSQGIRAQTKHEMVF